MKKLKLFAFFAMLPAAALLTSAGPDCPKYGDYGLFANPDNCSTFYECDWGTPVLQKCPDGLYWNDIIKVCDWP